MTESTRKTLTRPVLTKPRKQTKDNDRASTAISRPPRSGTTARSTPIKTGANSSQTNQLQEPELLLLKADSLALSLTGAAHAVSYVLDGTALPQALARVFGQTEYSPQIRGAIQDISYRTMRQVGRVDALITLMTNKPVEPPLLYSLLCCALSLLVHDIDETPPYNDFVVVDQAVNAAASNSHMVFAKGMINAVLRRFLREKESLIPTVLKQPAAMWNYPQWWVDQVKSAYPTEWQTILKSGNLPPPMTLRVNQRQIEITNYLKRLESEGIGAHQIGPNAIQLRKPIPVWQIPGFEQGMVSVQDAAAQLAAPLLDVQDGMRVLDACAAPGGKTGHILEIADVNLLAIETDAKRIERIHENLARLQLFAEIKQGDASRMNWWDGKAFDRILADVPCTASGVVRRHPDIRWLRRKTDAAQLAVTSTRILDNLWKMLKPGGKMLLVTCSIWPIESEKQAQAFAERHAAIRLPAPGQLLPSSDPDNEHDGLFYALFQKPEE